jgi:hypothetical protein
MEIDGRMFHLFERHRNLLARGARVDGARRVAEFSFGFPEATSIDLQARDDGEFLADADFGDEPYVEFGGKAKTFRRRGGGPEHRFVQHGCQDAAVNNAAKAGMLRLGSKIGSHLLAFATEAEVEAVRVLRTADETITSVRKVEFAHFMKTLKRRPTK